FLSQPFFVAEVFTGSPGKYVSLKDTIRGFKGIMEGEYDHLPETFRFNTPVEKLLYENDQIYGVKCADEIIKADAYVMAFGSYST
ncbi:hypothetical protein MJM99_32140, partial [Salmonella enterica subsp. enterica serovar Kentucky]|nr:hypothetical protein [Salmonella enterica subsp. enterica serovar Kentucky]